MMNLRFMGMTLKTNNNQTNGSIQRCCDQRNADKWKSNVKSMLVVSFDVKRHCISGFVPTEKSVNSKFYCGILRRLREDNWWRSPTLWKENNFVVPHTIMRFFRHHVIFDQKFKDCNPSSTIFTGCSTLQLRSVSKIETSVKRTQFQYHWRNSDQIADRVRHLHRSQLSKHFQGFSKMPGLVYMCGWGLLWRRYQAGCVKVRIWCIQQPF